MGTYLSTNLLARVSVNANDAKEASLNPEQLSAFLAKGANFFPEIYEYTEDGEEMIFEFKKQILAEELIPFLETFYGAYYHDSVRAGEALETIKSLPSEKWIEYIESGDSYDLCTYQDSFGLRNDEISLYFDAQYWRLTFEGKVMAEEMDAHMRLFDYTLTHAFEPFKLSKALQVTFL